MVFTITEQIDFNLLNSLDIMRLWSQIREEFIQNNREAMFSLDDLDKAMKLSSDYIYHSPVEETLNNMLEFDEKGRMGFTDISQALKSHGINESNNKVGSYLKLLAPEGKK